MDFDLTDEQGLLRDVTREALTRTYDIETRLKVGDTELGWSREVWSQLADIGILGLGFDPEEAGQIELMVVLTEIGRRLAPEPVAQAALIPGGLIAELGDDQQRTLLDEVAEGQTLLALAHQEPGMRGLTARVTTRAEQQGDSWTVTGRKNPVLSGDCADVFVVSAALPVQGERSDGSMDGGVGLFVVDADAISRRAYRTFDGQRAAQLDLDSVAARATRVRRRCDGGPAERADPTSVGAVCRSGRRDGGGAAAHHRIPDEPQAVRRAAEQVPDADPAGRRHVRLPRNGAQHELLRRDVDRRRELRPRHRCAGQAPDRRSGRHIAQEAIQMHGGIGVTAEYPVGHYAARLTAINQTLGSADDQLRTLIGALGSYGTVSL